MAVRSGAGTGVVVSLVVFILTTFFLLVLTIVFYSGQSKAEVAQADAEKQLSVYVKPGNSGPAAISASPSPSKRSAGPLK